MSTAREKMLQRYRDEAATPAERTDRARRHARSQAQEMCDAASEVLLLSQTIQKLGSRAWSLDARIGAAVERVLGGERLDPARGAKAERRLRDAHEDVSDLMAQLRAALARDSVGEVEALNTQLGEAIAALEAAIESRC